MFPEVYGFWEYTTPGAGACCQYTREDWIRLLDDMQAGGMNALTLGIRWNTTGYRSSLPWLDQDPACRVIATDNALLHAIIDLAQARAIRVWLAVVCSHAQVREYGRVPPTGKTSGSFFYDPDYPGMEERAVELMHEVASLFPAAAGLIVEMESVEFDWPYRVEPYNAWARAHGRKSYEELRQMHLDPRAYQIHDWRDYTAERRFALYRRIETAVRQAGYTGELASIIETGNEPGMICAVIKPQDYAAAMPGWTAVTYDYHRSLNRWAAAEFCMSAPKALGLKTLYLGRGIMTYALSLLSIPLEENWRRDAEDVQRFGVDGFWLFGADADRQPNPHCHEPALQSLGFADGRTARLRLLEIIRERRTARA